MALRFRMLPLVLLLAPLGGCYSYMNEHHHREPARSAQPERVPPARVTGPAVSCIPLTAYSETRVQDGRTIDFLAATGTTGWRNTLPQSCPGLASERAFSFATSLTQVCSTDIIRVLDHVGGQVTPGAACGLGRFTPIELPRR